MHFGQSMITWCPTIYSASLLSSISEEGKPLESPPRANFDNDILGLCVIICSYKHDCFFFNIFLVFDNMIKLMYKDSLSWKTTQNCIPERILDDDLKTHKFHIYMSLLNRHVHSDL